VSDLSAVNTTMATIASRVDAIQNTLASLSPASPSFADVLAGATAAELPASGAAYGVLGGDPTQGSAAGIDASTLGSAIGSADGSVYGSGIGGDGSMYGSGIGGGGSVLGSAFGANPGFGSPITGSAVVSDAEQYLGVPYVWGGTNPATGLDCSGLVQRVFGDLGISMPRVAADQAMQGTPVPSLADAQPGDLVTYGSPAEHIGIYIGNGMMIDAPHTGTTVRIDAVGTPTSIRRIVGSDDSSTTGALAGAGAYQGLFNAAGARYGISPNLLAAVAQVESSDNPQAVSGAGAEGLMQLMPGTAASLGVDPFDPAQAVDGGAQLLAQDLQHFGSVPLALAAYNAGAGAVEQAGGIPDYPQTQAYVQDVLAAAGEGQ
jgi:cell wall-associated NlpC family hydrolase